MTSETFEAEFVAWNAFRAVMGQSAYTRAQFAATVARHNATIAQQSGPSVLDYTDEALDEPTPEA